MIFISVRVVMVKVPCIQMTESRPVTRFLLQGDVNAAEEMSSADPSDFCAEMKVLLEHLKKINPVVALNDGELNENQMQQIAKLLERSKKSASILKPCWGDVKEVMQRWSRHCIRLQCHSSDFLAVLNNLLTITLSAGTREELLLLTMPLVVYFLFGRKKRGGHTDSQLSQLEEKLFFKFETLNISGGDDVLSDMGDSDMDMEDSDSDMEDSDLYMNDSDSDMDMRGANEARKDQNNISSSTSSEIGIAHVQTFFAELRQYEIPGSELATHLEMHHAQSSFLTSLLNYIITSYKRDETLRLCMYRNMDFLLPLLAFTGDLSRNIKHVNYACHQYPRAFYGNSNIIVNHFTSMMEDGLFGIWEHAYEYLKILKRIADSSPLSLSVHAEKLFNHTKFIFEYRPLLVQPDVLESTKDNVDDDEQNDEKVSHTLPRTMVDLVGRLGRLDPKLAKRSVSLLSTCLTSYRCTDAEKGHIFDTIFKICGVYKSALGDYLNTLGDLDLQKNPNAMKIRDKLMKHYQSDERLIQEFLLQDQEDSFGQKLEFATKGNVQQSVSVETFSKLVDHPESHGGKYYVEIQDEAENKSNLLEHVQILRGKHNACLQDLDHCLCSSLQISEGKDGKQQNVGKIPIPEKLEPTKSGKGLVVTFRCVQHSIPFCMSTRSVAKWLRATIAAFAWHLYSCRYAVSKIINTAFKDPNGIQREVVPQLHVKLSKLGI